MISASRTRLCRRPSHRPRCGDCGAGGKRHGPVLVQLWVQREAGVGGEVTMETRKALWEGTVGGADLSRDAEGVPR